jgi:hypothetical protein
MNGWTPDDRLTELTDAVCSGTISADDLCELQQRLGADPAARACYLDYFELHTELYWLMGRSRNTESVLGADSHQPSSPGFVASLGDLQSNATGFFASGLPLAYLIAAVILGTGLWISSLIQVSSLESIAYRAPSQPIASPRQPAAVATVTAMADCQWLENPKAEIRNPKEIRNLKFPVSLGDRLAILSGLLEITYDSGARVILQGPVTYEVESAVGGFLSVGRLTASVENAKPEDQRPKTEDLHPSSLIPHPLFVVRTPSALVTDLGTEFGVEVDKRGTTTSHVFRGSVSVQRTGGEKRKSDARIVSANQTVRVESSSGHPQIVTVRNFATSTFVREISRSTIKVFDLVDAMAGGNGFSGRREGAVAVNDGRLISKPWNDPQYATFKGDGRYHRVVGLPFVDGVFMPDGAHGPVQTDSAGNLFDGFPVTSNQATGFIQAGGTILTTMPTPIPAALSGVDYSKPGHGMIVLMCNKAITFDLEAIRRANPGYALQRFRAVAGNTGGETGVADFWVIVDGRVRCSRREVNQYTGGFAIAEPIGPQDRFLTLAATDGGDGVWTDVIVFCDPRIDLSPARAAGSDLGTKQEATTGRKGA